MNQILVYVLYAFLAVFILGTGVLLIGVFYKKETPEQKEAKKDAALAKKEEKKKAKAESSKNLIPTEPKRGKRNKEELVLTDTRAPVFKAENDRNPLAGFVNQPAVQPQTKQPVNSNAASNGFATNVDPNLLQELQNEDDNIPLQKTTSGQFPKPQHDLDFNTGSDGDEPKPIGRYKLPF